MSSSITFTPGVLETYRNEEQFISYEASYTETEQSMNRRLQMVRQRSLEGGKLDPKKPLYAWCIDRKITATSVAYYHVVTVGNINLRLGTLMFQGLLASFAALIVGCLIVALPAETLGASIVAASVFSILAICGFTVYHGISVAKNANNLVNSASDQRHLGFHTGFKDVSFALDPSTQIIPFLEKELRLLYFMHLLALAKAVNPNLKLPEHIEKFLPPYGEMSANAIAVQLMDKGAFSPAIFSRLGLLESPLYQKHVADFQKLAAIRLSVDIINPKYELIRKEKREQALGEFKRVILELVPDVIEQFDIENKPTKEVS